MLKLQLSSKIASLNHQWIRFEDILTADLFGVLDYLPRRTCLRQFVEMLAARSAHRRQLLANVDWENIEINFWPRIPGDRRDTEPDVAIYSNRWILIVESKFHSGFGISQPRREFEFGSHIAARHGAPNRVFLLVISKKRINIEHTFSDEPPQLRAKLLRSTFYLRWFEVYQKLRQWLALGHAGPLQSSQATRMVADLCDVLKLRPSLVFSGFSDAAHAVDPSIQYWLANPRTSLGGNQIPTQPSLTASSWLSAARTRRLFHDAPRVPSPPPHVFLKSQFTGFARRAQPLKNSTSLFLHTLKGSDNADQHP